MATIIQTDPGLERRRQLAMAMMQSGQSGAPVQHWTQGANRIAQSLLGAYNLRQAEQEQQQQQQMGQEALQQALGQFQRQPEQITTGGDDGIPLDLGAGVPTQGDAISRFAQVLAANPYTREYGSQLALQQQISGAQGQQAAQQQEMERRKQLQAQKELAEYKAQLGQMYPKPESEFDQYLKALQAEKAQAEIQKKQMELEQGQRAATTEQDNIQTAAGLAQSLKEHPGFRSIYGSFQGATPSMTSSSVDAEAIRDQLGNILTLAARGQLKGQGQITEGETAMLRNAQTMLSNPRISDEAAAQEVDRVITYLQSKGAEIPGQNLQGRRSGRSDLRKPGPPPGWTLMQDAQGNRAYVGPNGEVQEL